MFKKPFSFTGRIHRTELAISWVIGICFFFLIVLIYSIIDLGLFFNWAILIALIWFLASQQTKRCHDLGNNGFFQLIPFYILALFFLEGENHFNIYGENPKDDSVSNQRIKIFSLKIVIPAEKNPKVVAAELTSGSLLISLAIAAVNTIVSIHSIAFKLSSLIFVVVGYYLLIHLHYKQRLESKFTMFFILHRAIFSTVFYFIFRGYIIYSSNITDSLFSEIGKGFGSIMAIFLLTYIPFLIFKTRHIQKKFLEA